MRLSKVGTWETFVEQSDAAPLAPGQDHPFGEPGVTASANWTTSTTLSARTYSEWKNAPSGPSWRWFNFTQSTQGPATLSFTPRLTEPGLFDIYLWYPVHSYNAYSNSNGTAVSIQTGLGVVAGTVGQQSGTGQWRHVGRHALRASDYSDANFRPKVTVATPSVPASPPYDWWYTNQGYVLADGVMFVRDGENVDGDGDGVIDWYETLIFTSTTLVDTNGNGISDYEEWWPSSWPPPAALTLTVTSPAGAILND